MIDIFIPSYHRPNNIKTAKYLLKIGYSASNIHIFVDNEAEDIEEYEKVCNFYGLQLHIFDMTEARTRYDYIHRASPSRRSAGQARNMFQDFARENGISFYCVQDDDTNDLRIRFKDYYKPIKELSPVLAVFENIKKMMEMRKIGVFALPQSGDNIGGAKTRLFLRKVMNCTFYLLPYIYRGERGVQDDDTSLFCGLWNNGLMTGSLGCGLTLQQTTSATSSGGLTDLYNECKLLNKSLVTVIQYPSAIIAERQDMNGGRLHHRINYNYLAPRILRNEGGRDNIAWDTYPEDVPFTNEPKRTYSLNR